MTSISLNVLLCSSHTYSPDRQAELDASIARNGLNNIRGIVGNFTWTQDTSAALQNAFRNGQKELRCDTVPNVVSSRSI